MLGTILSFLVVIILMPLTVWLLQDMPILLLLAFIPEILLIVWLLKNLNKDFGTAEYGSPKD